MTLMTLRHKFFFILLSSIMLLALTPPQKSFKGAYRPKKISSALHTRLMLMRFDFDNHELANLAFATITGTKRGLKKQTKQAHQRLHLIHLFTPSGLHLSTLFIFLWPFLMAWKKTKRTLWLLPLFTLALAPQMLTGFWAMKRIGLLKFAFLFFKIKNKNISPFSLFLIVFTLDFFFGTYNESPLSFGLSFLFLGLIFSSLGEGKLVFSLSLLLGQVVASYFFESPLFIIGFFFGLFATGFFVLIYPFIFLAFAFAPWLDCSWIESILKYYLQFILTLSELTQGIGGIILVDGVVILTVLLFLLFQKKTILFLLLLSAPTILNFPPSHQSAPWYYQPVKQRNFTKIVRQKKGYRLKTQAGNTCLIKFYKTDGWSEYCRYEW